MTVITVKVQATLRRASQETCDRFGKPYGTFELIDPDGDRISWIDGKHPPAYAEIIAHDMLAEPLLSDGYNLNGVD